ncbi:hypothetical protein AB7M17_005260 [Bradyrhizobium sp. USDA 377]
MNQNLSIASYLPLYVGCVDCDKDCLFLSIVGAAELLAIEHNTPQALIFMEERDEVFDTSHRVSLRHRHYDRDVEAARIFANLTRWHQLPDLVASAGGGIIRAPAGDGLRPACDRREGIKLLELAIDDDPSGPLRELHTFVFSYLINRAVLNIERAVLGSLLIAAPNESLSANAD